MKPTQKRGIIKFTIAVGIILAIAFLSQQPFMRPYGIFVYNWSKEKISNYWVKNELWWARLYPGVEKEVVEKGGAVKEEVVTQKDNAVKNTWEKIKKYFAEKFASATGTKVE